MSFQLKSSEQIETQLGQCLEQIRLSRNITQTELASAAGVSRSTIARLAQAGKGISLDSFIRIMKALQLHQHLEAMLPDPGVSPLQQLEISPKPRQRARGTKTKPASGEWTWGDTDNEL